MYALLGALPLDSLRLEPDGLFQTGVLALRRCVPDSGKHISIQVYRRKQINTNACFSHGCHPGTDHSCCSCSLRINAGTWVCVQRRQAPIGRLPCDVRAVPNRLAQPTCGPRCLCWRTTAWRAHLSRSFCSEIPYQEISLSGATGRKVAQQKQRSMVITTYV